MRILGVNITYRQALPILVVGIAIAGVGFVIINQVQKNAVEKQAVKTAESVVAQMLPPGQSIPRTWLASFSPTELTSNLDRNSAK